MQSLKNSLALRLTIWFLLLSSLPLAVMAIFVHRNVADQFISYAVQTQQNQARFLAAQVAMLDDNKAVQTALAAGNGKNSASFVIDKNGAYIAHPHQSKVGSSVFDDFSTNIVEQFLTDKSGAVVDDETGRIIGYSALPEKNLVILSVAEAETISEPMSQTERSSLLQLAVSLFIISVVGGGIIWIVVGRPVRQLTGAARQIGSGNFDTRVNPDEMEDELKTLAMAVNQMAGQLRHMVDTLEQQVADRTQRLETVLAETETLYRINRQMVVATKLGDLVAAVMENLNIPAINRAILLVFEHDKNNNVEAMELVANWHSGQGPPPSPIGTRYQQTVIEIMNLFVSPHPVFFKNVQTDKRTDPGTKAITQQLNIKALAVLPLWHGGRQLGILVLQGEEPYQFSDQEIKPYLSTLGQLAAAVENQQLFEQTQQRANELSSLNQIARQVSRTTELQTVLEIVAKNLIELLHLSDVVISFVDEEKQEYTPVVHRSSIANRPLFVGQSSPATDFDRQVIESGKALILTLTDKNPVAQQLRTQLAPWNITCLMRVPLRTRRDILGLISLKTDQPGRVFSLKNAELAETIANQIAGVIENARLFEQEQRQRQLAEQATAAAEAANRAKSTFLTNMSHELRTPLNAVLGFAQIIKRNPNLPEKEKERLNIIGQSGEHLLELINDILEISKIETGQDSVTAEDFDLLHLLSDLEIMLRVRADKKELALSFKRQDEVPQFIKSDERKLRQILINLLGNAIKFTETGEVTLHVMQKDECRMMNKEFTHPSSFILLTFEVSDTGPGIAPEETERLFKPFTQTQAGLTSAEGSGLGLAISRHFVQLMGGSISVHSKAGRGATFTVKIPVEKGESTPVQAGRATRQVIGLEANQPEYRILVVDDNGINRDLLCSLLGDVGFVTKEAENGRQGVEVFESWAPHLILMDIRMPVMDGYEATRQIKSNATGQTTTVIAVTAGVFETDRQMILSSGCDDFIRKPFKTAEIFGKISQHLGARYLYGPPSETGGFSESREAPPPLAPINLSILPAKTIAGLHHVVCRGEIQGTRRIIIQIQAEHPTLAQRLGILLKEFDFEKLIELTEAELP